MSGDRYSEDPFSPRDQFEASKKFLTAEELCLAAVFDMSDVDKIGAYQSTGEFFASVNDYTGPEDLTTNIHSHQVIADKVASRFRTFPDNAKVIATVSVGINARSSGIRDLYNIDFVQTDDGLKAFKKAWFIEGDEHVTKYVGALNDNQLSALSADAKKIARIVIDRDTELLKLGPLLEEAGPDGIRRFHVGDILSVITGKMLSARGWDGLYDILDYMTNEMPFSTQLSRFVDECKPYLRRRFDERLAPFYDPPEEAVADAPSVYRWLGEISSQLGDPFLTIFPIPEDQHARIDVRDELELDYGSDIVEKFVILDLEESDEL